MTEGAPIPSQEEQPKSAFELAIEEKTGESLDSLRNTPIEVRRVKIEEKFGKPMTIFSEYPFIIVEENLPNLSHYEIENILDEALRD